MALAVNPGELVGAGQPTLHQTLEKRPPVDLMLAERDGDAQDHSFALFVESHSLQHRCIAYLAIAPDLLVMSIQPEVVAEKFVEPPLRTA